MKIIDVFINIINGNLFCMTVDGDISFDTLINAIYDSDNVTFTRTCSSRLLHDDDTKVVHIMKKNKHIIKFGSYCTYDGSFLLNYPIYKIIKSTNDVFYLANKICYFRLCKEFLLCMNRLHKEYPQDMLLNICKSICESKKDYITYINIYFK